MHPRTLYKKLPQFVKTGLKCGYGALPLRLRVGKEFFRQLNDLEQRQWWTPQELRDYQNERLRALVRHAYAHVPYYRRLFRDCKLAPRDIRSVEDLHKIPLLSKDTVRADPDAFVTRGLDRRNLFAITTSGTTGKVVPVYADYHNEHVIGNPYEWRFYRWAGYNPDDLCAVFRAQFDRRKDIYQYNPVQKKVFFSIYDITGKNIFHYYSALRNFPFRFLKGYPAALAELVKGLREAGLSRPFSPRAIFTFAEVLSADQRGNIEEYFNAKIHDWYSMEERNVIACQCGCHRGYHVNSDYGIVEFGKPDPGFSDGAREIITTGLSNFVMPFIRYKTEDYGFPVEGPCPCRRGFPLMYLSGGRKRMYIMDKKGRYHRIMDYLEAYYEYIAQYQYHQRVPGKVTMCVIPRKTITPREENVMRAHLLQRYGEDFEFDFKPVRELDRTASGKTLLVVSSLSGAHTGRQG
ncbi:MAG: hypothetical protein GF333_00595 [Candidatus Omnitrophica bacterium]|nr:hypothetical protein [Candidatus Omnitrophota bacterium]